VAWREPLTGLLLSNVYPINHPCGDQRAARQRERENYVMSKSATKPTDNVQPVNTTRTKNNAPGHPANRNPSRCTDWQPSSWPFRPEDASPLVWWRTMPADLLRDAEQLVLRETIRKVGVLKGCEWVSAMRGDVPASIAIVLQALPITTITLEVDLAMTTLMLGALAGSAASALVLSQVLQRTSLITPSPRSCRCRGSHSTSAVPWARRSGRSRRAARATAGIRAMPKSRRSVWEPKHEHSNLQRSAR
jgi:hypothetical protein